MRRFCFIPQVAAASQRSNNQAGLIFQASDQAQAVGT